MTHACVKATIGAVGSSALLGAAWARPSARGMALVCLPGLRLRRGSEAGRGGLHTQAGDPERRLRPQGSRSSCTARPGRRTALRDGPRTPPRPQRPRSPPARRPYDPATPHTRGSSHGQGGTARPAHEARGTHATRWPSRIGTRPDGATPLTPGGQTLRLPPQRGDVRPLPGLTPSGTRWPRRRTPTALRRRHATRTADGLPGLLPGTAEGVPRGDTTLRTRSRPPWAWGVHSLVWPAACGKRSAW